MDYDAAEYRKLPIKQYPGRALRETAEGKYWKQFKAPLAAKQFGAVTNIDFCTLYPHNFAVTTSTRVVVYDAQTCSVRRTFTRFKDKAYSGTFRSDGRLLVAGGEEGLVQVFDASSRGLLRQLKGHQRPVHVASFAPDKVHVLSGGDDALARWWDVGEGRQVLRLAGHADYVRAAAVNPASQDAWATGGYDHICKLWDVRSGQCSMSVEHGAPVESVAFFPSGSLLVTAGGTQLCVWDLFAGGRLLRRLSNHQKTITSVLVSPAAGPEGAVAPRMLSASLDGHVKVYELDTLQVTHASKYPAPVLSLGLAPSCSLLAVGMADGVLSVRRHLRPLPREPSLGAGGQSGRQRYKPRLTAASYRYFIRGQGSAAAAGDYVVAARKRAALSNHDRLLRRFRYGDALDAALATRRPEVVASLLEELAVRGGLGAALVHRLPQNLLPLLDHVRRHVGDPRYATLLAGVAHRLLDAYSTLLGADSQVSEALAQVRERVALEVRTQDELVRIRGVLEPLLLAAGAATYGG